MPDNAAAAAASIMATAAGATSVRTTPLLTVAEADAAIGKLAKAKYRPPGG